MPSVGVHLPLNYKDGWSDEERAADEKMAALNEIAQRGGPLVTRPNRGTISPHVQHNSRNPDSPITLEYDTKPLLSRGNRSMTLKSIMR